MRLKGLAAVVTGGGSGIGLAIAREFAAEGAGVALFGRDRSALEAAAKECGPNALAVPGDVCLTADLDRLFRDAHAHFGRLDIVVANAGIALARPFEAVDEDTFDRVSETNFKGTFFTVQKAAHYLRPGGSVILVSSALGHLGVAELAVYAATKAAIRSLGRTLCAALLPKGVRVNVLSPGPVATPIFDKMGLPPEVLDNRDAVLLADVAMKRFADPREIARAAVFLASSDSSFMAGAELMADGGHAQI
jgi:NAD(P)-dependent dehydrogenase (short-subunit alcohol dehydrogenase family)